MTRSSRTFSAFVFAFMTVWTGALELRAAALGARDVELALRAVPPAFFALGFFVFAHQAAVEATARLEQRRRDHHPKA